MENEERLDFTRSFAINTAASDGVERNTCRTQLLARCALPDGDGGEREYFLGKECIGEYMYQERGIAQEPTAEVCIIFSADDSSLLKKFANHERDVVQAGEMTVARKSFDGSDANWTALSFALRRVGVRPLRTVDDIIEATLGGEPMVGRTTIASEDGAVVLDYPISYVNIHPPDQRFQVDVGPILYPDGASDGAFAVERLQLAYVMYNELDRAEFAIRRPTQVAPASPAETLHYSEVIRRLVRSELFSLGA